MEAELAEAGEAWLPERQRAAHHFHISPPQGIVYHVLILLYLRRTTTFST
jgi:hypothetical protein